MTNEKTHSRIAAAIRNQANSAATRRYASSLPQYSVSNRVPRYMLDMLRRLEQAENSRKS